MGKLVFGLAFIICFGIIGLGIYGFISSKDDKDTAVTLEQVVNKFTSAEALKDYADMGLNITAVSEADTLTISVDDVKYIYTLTEGILSATLKNDDLNGAMVLMTFIDSIGQLHGYKEGETFATLNSAEIAGYTIEKGLEMVVEGDTITVKIDINKKLELVDFTKVYIQISDFDDNKEYITGDGSAQFGRGNLIFHKEGHDDEAIIIIGEKDKLTDNAYKSLLSTIELIYDKTEADKFAVSYPTLSDKVFDRYILEIDPKLDESDSFMFGDEKYGIIRLTIDKSK